MMTPPLYTIERVAELLNLHVKTVRAYVRSGRLKATRIGKSYRITRADLEAFAGTSAIDLPATTTQAQARHVILSSIVDADGVTREVADRISTLLMSALNSRRGGGSEVRADVIYYPEQSKLRVTITGSPDIAASLVRVVTSLLEQ